MFLRLKEYLTALFNASTIKLLNNTEVSWHAPCLRLWNAVIFQWIYVQGQNQGFIFQGQGPRKLSRPTSTKSGQLRIADRCALIFKVTQGHWLIHLKNYIHNFLLVINWDLSSISHCLQDMVPRCRELPYPILRPQIKELPWISSSNLIGR